MCLSDYAIDRLVAGEPREGDEAHATGCAVCAAAVVARRAERDRFRREAPLLPARPTSRRRWLAAPALAAVAALVLALAWPAREPGTRSKGARVHAFVRHDGQVRAAARREVVAPGDAVQLTVTLDAPRHVAVVGVDGAGRETVYREPAPLPAGVGVPLEFSIVLDDTPGEERLTVLFCDGPSRVGCRAEELVLVKP